MQNRPGILINDPKEALRSKIVDDLQVSAAVYRHTLDKLIYKLSQITEQDPGELLGVLVGQSIYELGIGE